MASKKLTEEYSANIPNIWSVCSLFLCHRWVHFVFFSEIPDKKQQLQALNLLIILLPDVHRDTLKVTVVCVQIFGGIPPRKYWISAITDLSITYIGYNGSVYNGYRL